MNYAVTGTDDQWKDALKGEDPTSVTNIQIATQTEKKVLPRIDEKEMHEESNRSIPGNKRNNPTPMKKSKKRKKQKRKTM